MSRDNSWGALQEDFGYSGGCGDGLFSIVVFAVICLLFARCEALIGTSGPSQPPIPPDVLATLIPGNQPWTPAPDPTVSPSYTPW